MPDETIPQEGEVVETSSTETEVVTEGGTEETGTPPAEEKTPEEKEAESKATEADKEKRFTNEDMKKLRQSLQHETKKEREARIRAEEREKVLRELLPGQKQPDGTAKTTEPEIVLPPRPKRPIAPQEDGFQTREEYVEAIKKFNDEVIPQYEDSLFEWRREVDQKNTEASQKQEEAKKTLTAAEKFREEVTERGTKKYDDFKEVVMDKPTLNHNVNVQSMIINRHKDIVEDMAYYLEKNPAEAAKLNAITDAVDLALELRTIAAKFKASPAAPQAKTTTKAPAPPATVQAKAKVSNDTTLSGKSQEDRVRLIEQAAIERRKRGG